MSETPKSERKRDIAARYLKMGLDEGQEQLKKGEMTLKHAVGLGPTPNVVPEGEPRMNESLREVHVGWHPVGGAAGKWFADDTRLGKLIAEKTNKYPDPTQHWAVLVGDYVHQLWMDENFDVIYTNDVLKPEEWTTFHVGYTKFNDDALRRTGETVIAQIREKQPTYNLITNNCQTYALLLLDVIKTGAPTQFATTHNVYQAIIGPGAVKDLFKSEVEGGEAPTPPQEGEVPAVQGEQSAVNAAQKVMNQNTPMLDYKGQDTVEQVQEAEQEAAVQEATGEAGEREIAEGDNADGEKKKKKGLFARVKNLVSKPSKPLS